MDDRAELERLVSAARDRDREAIGRLFDRYYDAVYRYSYARLANVGDAEDAAADTFDAVVRALPGFRWKGVPFEAWLFRIARSKVVDLARRRSRRALDTGLDAELADGENEPERIVQRLEERRVLMAAVERLPGPQRDVILLRFFLQRSIRETALSLRRSEGAVKQLQLRALANLRRLRDR